MMLDFLPQAEEDFRPGVTDVAEIPVCDGEIIGRRVGRVAGEVRENGGDIHGMFAPVGFAEGGIVGSGKSESGGRIGVEVTANLGLLGPSGAVVDPVHWLDGTDGPVRMDQNLGSKAQREQEGGK